jgi:hypothetical protein
MRTSRNLRLAILALLGLLMVLLTSTAFAASGYIVYLKDGSTITAKEKYKVDKQGRAIITLLNGTQSFIPLMQVDVARTDQMNREGYGSAVVIPGAPQDVTPVPGQPQKDRTLADLIKSREAAPRDLPGSRREKSTPAGGRLMKTRGGFNDLATLPPKPYPHAEIATELQQLFRGQGFEEVEIYEGTQGDRPMLEITTNSEGSVFKALGTAANALLRVRDLYPNTVGALELLMTTPTRERAGQFVLTPDQASELAAKTVDVASFFVHNVQF